MKREAATHAISYIEDGMAVGLGTGSTAKLMIDALGERVRREGLKIRAIPTSEASAAQAQSLNIPITNFINDPYLDVAIDGADEVQTGSLFLIKGRGGALLREKIVAVSSRKFIVIVDESKIVTDLGTHLPLPVETIPWGWERVENLLRKTGAKSCVARRNDDGSLYMTDNHNIIIDCDYERIESPRELADRIISITGVVDHGLFLDTTTEVLVAGASGLQRLKA
ncbi:ribose-5-phosphate isomerase RpiA [Asaia astilbis]|uniref:ribose-5-phosphate isomerase RpiA n=1 Tax=Asaia astilbis TaxID=610244 RepID=UPI00056254D7